jgi:hypothetical protein
MTPLGHIRTGVMRIASRAANLAREHGEVAVFVGTNGQTAAVAWYEPDYDYAVRSRGSRVAGVYRHNEEKGGPQIARLVREDLLSMIGRN